MMMTTTRPLSPPCCLFFLFVGTIGGPAAAAEARQRPPGRVVTLEEALEIAESRSEQMAVARAGIDRAAGELSRARSDLFPQVSGAASYDRALATEFEDFFDTTGAPCPPFMPAPSAPIGERLTEIERAVDCGATGASVPGFTDFGELPFGRRNTYRFSLSFSQNLFSGGRIGARTAVADAGRRGAAVSLASTRAQLLLDVVRAYYDAALAERLLAIAEATYELADATLKQTRLEFETGSQPEFELLRAQVGRDNLRPAIIRSRADRDLAMLRLKQLLDIPRSDAISLAAVLEGETLAPPARFAAVAQVLAADDIPDLNRAPIRDAQIAVDRSEAAAAAARAQRRPTVSLTSFFEQVAYPAGAAPGLDDFRRNWTVGALVQVPILTGGRVRADEALARAETRMAEARLQQARELALLDTHVAYEELRAAEAAWVSSAGTVQQAERAHEIAELRYREGVSTQLELSDARLLLAEAQVTRAQAARDVQIARARVALLPDLPIEGAAAPALELRASPAAPPRPAIPSAPPRRAATGTQRVAGGR